ncbi:MAG: hypothetical protein K2K70_11035, partial [Lachnospiraceae bacterium]|nr:hypothetical protein [Lachnospiraceae bacterium]
HEDEDLKILAQVSENQMILQTFSEKEIELYPGKKAITEFLGVTNGELIFYANLDWDADDTNIWYRIPLSYENGQEKVLCDKKEIIYEDKDGESVLSCGVGKYLFCEDDKGCFVLDQESGEKKRIVEDSKQISYGYCKQIDPWVSPEGDGYIVLNQYRDGLVVALYAYQMGTGNVQKITDGISSESRIAYGDGKLFFTRLVDEQKCDDYNIYVYDMISGQKKVLASEVEIQDVLPEKPSDHADFIRELAYDQGMLYLEVRYAGQSSVISCAVDQGTLTVLDEMSELVRQREYRIAEPIENGNSKYYNVNDHNIFEPIGEHGIVERTLDGAYVRTIHLPYDFVYANNQELIYEFTPDPCGDSILYSIPLTYLDGNDYPEINRREILLSDIDGVGSFYADEKYLVYITSNHDFTVYDRQAQKFIDISGLPQERHSGNIPDQISGKNVFFNSKSENRKTDTFGFSLYHFGDNKVTRIDPRCYTSAPAYWCEDGKTIVYESHSDDGNEVLEICSYNINTGDRTVLFTEKDLQAAFKQVTKNQDIETYFECFFASDKIFYLEEASKGNECWVFSYDLAGEGKLEYESNLSTFINADRNLELGSVDVAEGKLFIKKCQFDEDEYVIESSVKYYYYDLSTGKHGEFGENDKEGLYLSLVDLYC